MFSSLSRFVNFRDNPLTLDVTLIDEDQMDQEDDREMFGREFMHVYIHKARARVSAALHVTDSTVNTSNVQ